MPWKDKEKQREAIRKHYYANKQMYIDKAQKRRQNLRIWLCNLKEASPCTDCGVKYPYFVMDFDHIGEKTMNISQITNMGNVKQLKAELLNCELVCANCHRARTFGRIKENKRNALE